MSDECKITISLSEDVQNEIVDPGVAGEYMANGLYCLGWPVLQYPGGDYQLYTAACWRVSSGNSISWGYLFSRSAPSLCPADPRAARNESLCPGETNWRYRPID